MTQFPLGELELWAKLTSNKLKSSKKNPVSFNEMLRFVGYLFAMTQIRKVGGVTKAFEKSSDGLFPAQDLGRFGMTCRQFQEIMQYWEFADESDDNVDDTDADPYW